MEYNDDYKNYQLNRGWLRKNAKKIYINNTLKYVKGKSIDFGCGIGELLTELPEGSVGFEINKAAVEYCNKKKLNVKLYNPDIDDYKLNNLNTGEFKTMIISHVLEHLENAHEIIRQIMKTCNRLSIERVIIIVPCIKGFNFDLTHKTFVDISFLKKLEYDLKDNYNILIAKYFPLNFLCIGKYFTYNELFVVLEKII
ncbi:MAG: methionine biosynthesis protein MetW [Spirochaetota bacterium]|nr:methionine biosynthesis protein MetW [Spirochaetota bacterium]